MKDKEIYKTVKQYEDGLITPVECLLNLSGILSEEMKVVKEIERFLQDISYGKYLDNFFIAGKLLYFQKKLNLK